MLTVVLVVSTSGCGPERAGSNPVGHPKNDYAIRGWSCGFLMLSPTSSTVDQPLGVKYIMRV